MKTKDKKRNLQLKTKSMNESLMFQTQFYARQKWGTVPANFEERLTQEVMAIQEQALAEDILTLKQILTEVQDTLNARPEPANDIMKGLLCAYCLGIETADPFEREFEPADLRSGLPLRITLTFDNRVRNQVVELIKAMGNETTTYLGQPLLKLKQMRVVIQRVVKP